MKKLSLIKIMGLLSCLAVSSFAQADCGWAGGYTSPPTATFNFAPVFVQRDTPVGTVLATSDSGSIDGGASIYGCNEPWSVQGDVTLFTTQTSIDGVYETNLRGIGLKMINGGGRVFPYPPFTVPGSYYITVLWSTAQLIKIAPGAVQGGSLTQGPAVTSSMTGRPDLNFKYAIGTSNIIPVACTISTPNINVPLDDVFANSFTSVGTTAKPKDFNVGLDCDEGARVNAQLTGTQNSDTSADGVLQLTGAGNAGVASGVGVQILYNGVAMALNNNMVLKTSNGGQESFPFTAQYYQTKADVTSGSANATATLELTYQ